MTLLVRVFVTIADGQLRYRKEEVGRFQTMDTLLYASLPPDYN